MVCVHFMVLIAPDLSSGVSWALLNQSMPPFPSFIILMTFLFTNAMDMVYS